MSHPRAGPFARDTVSEFLQGMVAASLVIGLVVLKVLGKPSDALDTDVTAVVVFYFGVKVVDRGRRDSS